MLKSTSGYTLLHCLLISLIISVSALALWQQNAMLLNLRRQSMTLRELKYEATSCGEHLGSQFQYRMCEASGFRTSNFRLKLSQP
jgi:hypothetical protein